MIIEKHGNIFTTSSQTIVNTVNCVGVMGAGIAYEFRLREPEMFQKYKALCEKKQLNIGSLWLYGTQNDTSSYTCILNFPTKYDWKYPSKEEYLHKGLQKFVATYKEKNIRSIAFPLLGADKGGIKASRSLEIMKSYLAGCDIDIEIWSFDPSAKDDLYESFRSVLKEIDLETLKRDSKIRIDKLKMVKESIQREDINSLSGLLRIKGIGDATLEKLFAYIKTYKSANINLFNYGEHV